MESKKVGVIPYKHYYTSDLIEHMAQGNTYTTFQAKLFERYKFRVSRSTLEKWTKRHPEFGLAKEIGESSYQRWWELINKYHSNGIWPASMKEQQTTRPNNVNAIFGLKMCKSGDFGDQAKLRAIENGNPVIIEKMFVPQYPRTATEDLLKARELLKAKK